MSFDHILLPCAANLLSAELAFLNAALEPLGIKEQFRVVPEVVAFGNEQDKRFFWVSGFNRNNQPIKEGEASGIHIAFKAKGEFFCLTLAQKPGSKILTPSKIEQRSRPFMMRVSRPVAKITEHLGQGSTTTVDIMGPSSLVPREIMLKLSCMIIPNKLSTRNCPLSTAESLRLVLAACRYRSVKAQY